jgi:CRP-like cAMP-binding protein
VAEGSAIVTAGGIPVATIGPGETIGELALLDRGVRSGTVTAATPMVLHELDGDRFDDVLRRAPGLALSLARQLARRLRLTNQHVVDRNGRMRPSAGD